MKRLLIILAVAALTLTSCSSNTSEAPLQATDSTLVVQDSFPAKLDSCALIDTVPVLTDSAKK